MSDTKTMIERVEAKIEASEAAKIKLVKYTNRVVWTKADCFKCGGSGIYSQFHGHCWACNGMGTRDAKTFVKVWPEGSSEAQIEAWEAEVERRSELRRLKKQLATLKATDVKESAAIVGANQLLANTPGLVEALKHDHDISRDLAKKLFERGTLSEKQVALAFRLVEQNAKRAEETAKALPAPEGRHIVEGVVLCVKIQDSHFGSTLKMLVKDERGFKVWTSVPKSMDPAKGDNVRIKVTLSPKKEDPKFAFGSRPVAA